MPQIEVNLRDLYRVLRKRYKFVILTPVLMGAASFFFTPSPPPVYQAEALVKVTRSSTLPGLMADLISYSTNDNMATQIMVITSQPVLQEVAARMGMTPPDQNPQVAVDRLKSQVSAEQRSGSDILAIKASAPSAEEATGLANTVAEVYIVQSSAQKEKRMNDMVQFIRRRVEETTGDLNQAERKLAEFKRVNAMRLAVNPTKSVEIQEKRFQFGQKLQDAENALNSLTPLQGGRDYAALLNAYVQVDDAGVRGLADEVTKRAGTLLELSNKQKELLKYQTAASPEVQNIGTVITAEDVRLQAQLNNLVRRLSTLQTEYRRLDQSLSGQQAELTRQPDLLAELEGLQTVVKEKQELAATLRKQSQEAELQFKEKVDDFTLVERANSASALLPASRYRAVLIGVIIGLLLGSVFAFVLESLDTSIGTIEDVENYMGSPVLGVIPHIDLEEVHGRLRRDAFPAQTSAEDLQRFAILTTHFDPNSVPSESYRTMRTQISSILSKNDARILMITSSALEEGKTTTATNLAIAFAQGGQKVLLIDADLRRPNVDKIFGVDRHPGLTDILLGTRDLPDCCRSINDLILGRFGLKAAQLTPGLEYLHLLTAGRSVENPAEVLASPNMDRLLHEARLSFDITILDLSPVLPVADSSILASKVDGVILSYQIGRIGRDLLRRSKMRLEGVGAKIWGLILNDIQAEFEYWHSGYQYYHYRYQPRLQWEGLSWSDRARNIFSRYSPGHRKHHRRTAGSPVAPPLRPVQPQLMSQAPAVMTQKESELELAKIMEDELP